MKKMSGLVMIAIVFILGMPGCLPHNALPAPTGGMAFYHSSPDAPDVNIFLDKVARTSQAFKYKNYTNYLNADEGSHNIRFNNFSNGTNLLDSTLSIEANKPYSIFLINKFTNLELLKVLDLTAVPSTGTGKVRFIHLSPDAPAVDVMWAGQTTPLFSDQKFKQFTEYTEVPINTYTLQVKVKGGSGVTLSVKDVQIKEGAYYTILLEGFDVLPTGNTNLLSARVVTN